MLWIATSDLLAGCCFIRFRFEGQFEVTTVVEHDRQFAFDFDFGRIIGDADHRCQTGRLVIVNVGFADSMSKFQTCGYKI